MSGVRVTIAIHGEPAIVVRDAHRYSGESGVWLGGGCIGTVEFMGEVPAIIAAFRRFADAMEAELETAKAAEPGTCPWCGVTGRPVPNDEHREDEPEWLSRNPVRCRVETCGGVGDWEDWGLAADGTALPADWGKDAIGPTDEEIAATFHVEPPDKAMADLPACESEVGP